MQPSNHLHRKIRSYNPREGRMSITQRQALANLWPLYGLEFNQQLINFSEIFNRETKTVLEIGFGMGHSLFTTAQQNPDINYIGIEVFRTGIASLFAMMVKNPLHNIRVFCADAVEVLLHSIPDQSLDTLQIFFPDPWPKTRHHKRRLIQIEFVKLALKKLKTGGILHLATDWENYAIHMLNTLNQCEGLINTSANQTFCPRPDSRPQTKYEQRGKRLGHEVWDLMFKKQEIVPLNHLKIDDLN